MATQSNSNSIHTSNGNQSANQTTFPSLNFAEINELGLQHFDAVVDRQGLNGEYQGQEYLCINLRRPEDSRLGSFKINTKSGLWSDFATNDAGGDLISFLAYVKNISYKQAALQLQSLLIGTGATTVIESTHNDGGRQAGQDQPKGKPEHNELVCVTPVPDDAPEPPKEYGKKGIPAGIYFYRNAKGQLLFHVLRFESAGGKSFSPLSLFRDTKGVLIWKMKGIAGQKPLYNLHLLAKFAERPVLIVEGEKAADAAALLFPDHVVVTTSNGAKAADKTDFSPLKGRNVFIWPDNDKAGEEYAADLVRLLRNQDNECPISIMKPLAFTVSSDLAKNAALVPGFEPEKGFDAADALALGWTDTHIKLLPEDAWEVVSADTSYFVANNAYFVSDEGVHLVMKSEKGDDSYIWICAPLHVTALSRDYLNSNWGIVLNFKDADDVVHQWCMPKSVLAGGNAYRKTLLQMGLDITQQRGNNDHLADYLLRANPAKRAIAVTKPGWYQTSFVFPERVVGNLADSVVFSTSDPKSSGIFTRGGNLEEWQQNVAMLCVGNSRLVLALCAGLASPLLHLLNIENGGFHIYGSSSTGKSTAGLIYASIWGGGSFIQQWRTTSNALESIAERHNDTGLVIDELAQIDPNMAGEVAYMLGNGQGKARANRNGESREAYTWRVIFFSTGEITLSDHIGSIGGRVMAGQEVRLINIPADPGASMGVFETIHEADNPAEFAALIKENTAAYFGQAGPALVELLVPIETREAYLNELRGHMQKFLADYMPSGSSGQATRVANRFALLAAVGELAISHGILPWPAGEANRGIGQCFKAWLDDRDGAGDAEIDQAIAQVRSYMELYGETRFTPWILGIDNNAVGNTRDRTGFRKTTDDGRTQFYILPEAWKSQVCRGLNSRRVTAILLERGLIIRGPDGAATRSERLPGIGSSRVYVISPDILGSSN